MKIRVGIFFGGVSREREVSFAGGRTVYDNLDQSLFEPVPLFLDHFGQVVLLDWQYIYKGSIRDFFPPADQLPEENAAWQLYADSLALTREQSREMLGRLGRVIALDELPSLIDLAFLTLHGHRGEDGSIQGVLEWLNIPYTGSGIYASALGMSKQIQKEQQTALQCFVNRFDVIHKGEWEAADVGQRKAILNRVSAQTGFPLVVKPANQGSSIGVAVLYDDDLEQFSKAVDQAFFTMHLNAADWRRLHASAQIERVREISDLRSGVGLLLLLEEEPVFTPAELLKRLQSLAEQQDLIRLRAWQTEQTVLCESFIEGREFSCIVIRDDAGKPIALPPTEIRKGKEVFDYRSKYLPGLSSKITPMDVAPDVLEKIRSACTSLYQQFHFDVYARIDGFLSKSGEVFLNDPNTTSGMMPSSFFFHQAAEIGLNPSAFLTFIVRNSLAARAETWLEPEVPGKLLARLDAAITEKGSSNQQKRPIAVIMGGYSFERHISVESGRNIYEKLSSSEEFEPVPVFLAGGPDPLLMFELPVNAMLKDNADDIREKLLHPEENQALDAIRRQCAHIAQRYNPNGAVFSPRQLSMGDLQAKVEGVFIALHGRPGEDGVIQKQLEQCGLYYNGSGPRSSAITIDKYATNELLRASGFTVAGHCMVNKEAWGNDRSDVLQQLERLGFPLIAKPHDDGCSAAVKKIRNAAELEAYASLIFRETEAMDQNAVALLGLHSKEEFPQKDAFLCETLIDRGDSIYFLEITGGMLTALQPDGSLQYQIFEPSETLAEHGILSLEEKFLAGQGQNITPARYAPDPFVNKRIADAVKTELEQVARVLDIRGYCRIDAFVKADVQGNAEVIFIEVNSLPGMTPATCIYHQAALEDYKPFEFIREILNFGRDYQRKHGEKMAH